MPHRARHVSLARQDVGVNEAVRNLAEHGILSVRRRRTGEITQVKMLRYGWVTVGTYANIQLLRDAQPYILEIIRGGYELKAWVWSTQIPLDVLASGSALPFGVVIIIVAIAEAVADVAAGNQLEAFVDLAALALPFGELWILFRGLQLLYDWTAPATPSPGNPLGLSLGEGFLFATGGAGLGIDLVDILSGALGTALGALPGAVSHAAGSAAGSSQGTTRGTSQGLHP